MIDYSLSPYATGTTDPFAAEEERKRREREAIAARMEQEAMANPVAPVEPTPIKETRTINPATGEVKLSITGNERDLTAANANTPTYSGAKPADNTFDRMIQAESGGRQTDAQGRVLTSNKGALGVAQVMPTTAMQPGYGVTNIFDLAQQRGIPFQNRDRATAEQLLANKALNQEFGQNYYNAMNKRFDGGPGAVAAYNAGPGRVSQNMAQNQGQLNVAQLPQETQGYLQKVGMPMQGQRPSQPVSPQQVAQQVQQPMAANQGIKIPGLTSLAEIGQQQQNTAQAGIQRFQSNQDNVDELVKMRNDQSVPEHIRKRSGERAYELMNAQYKTEQATNKVNEMVQSGDNLALAKTLTSKPKDEEGSYLKMILLGFLNPEAAGAEAVKLGLSPTKWTQTSYTDKDGNQIGVEIKTRSDGKILGGTKFDGTPLTTNELNLVSTASPLGKGASLSAEVYVDPLNGQRYRSGFDNAGKAALVNIQGGAAYRGDPKNLVLQSIGTAQARADIGLISDLKKKHGTNVLEAEKDYVALNGPFKSQGDRLQFRQAYGFEQALPVAGATQGLVPTQQQGMPTQGATTQPAAPAQAGAVTPSNINVPLAVQQQDLEAQKKVKESQAKNSYQARQLAPFISQIRDLIPKTTSSGVGTVVDAAGRIIGMSNEGADAIAAMAPLADKVLKTVERFEGPQSNIDVESYKEAAGKLSDPTVPVSQKRAAFSTIIDILKRQAPDVKWNEVLMTKEDKAAMKWANEHPDDPRSKEIKKRFE